MKKIFLLLFVISLTGNISCGSYALVSDVTNKVELGMTKTEFLEIAGKRAEKDAMAEGYYVYRVNQYDIDGSVMDSMFYYFNSETDTLYKVNAGVKPSENVNVTID